ncbi:MAG: phospholipase D-like domain-containing protein [Bacteroidales bacterium]|nr:phospholipase D-like domain-containing protein [Bacteroidales bacterium]
MTITTNTLLDNSVEELQMASAIRDLMSHEECNKIKIATGYWDIPGTSLVLQQLSEFLKRDGTTLQLLIGTDPVVRAAQQKNPKYKDAHNQKDYIRCDLQNLEVKEQYVDVVRLLKEYCLADFDASRIQIKMCKTDSEGKLQFFHAKCYIFLGNGFAKGIIGSSNFTQKGLEGNSELNYLEWNDVIVATKPGEHSKTKGHNHWFEEKWNQAEEWNKIFLEEVLQGTPIGEESEKPAPPPPCEPFTPYEQYIKLLQLKFGDVVDISLGQQIEAYLPDGIRRLNYQIEAVKRCIGIMREHGGFMLSDVVGLGKTIVGTLIVKHFLASPADDEREHKALIVTPPAIQSSWRRTIALFDKDSDETIEPHIDFITTGRVRTFADDDDDENGDDENGDTGDFLETVQEKNYGLIIIDECHKFRNSNTKMYKALDDLISKIGASTGLCPYIGLLSATPQNNSPEDLKNQIYLFERNHNESTLKKAEGGNLERFFSIVKQQYKELTDNNCNIESEERKQKLDSISRKIRDCVLSDILERRTRTDVEKFYAEDMMAEGLVFPKIEGPNSLKYIMDDELAQLFYDTMAIIAPQTPDDKGLHYYRYRAIEYFADASNEKKHTGRGNRSVADISKQLATIMQILLVKRLESSFAAFYKSLLNLRRYTENMITMWENDTIFVCPQIDVNKELDTMAKSEERSSPVTFNDCANDIRKKIQKLTEDGLNDDGQNAEYRRSDFNEEYISLIKKDHQLILSLCDRWALNPQDPKFDAFKENLNSELFNPQKNTSGKLVIFSEAIDTVTSLERAVKAKNHKPLVVTAKNRNDLEKTIAENFDANYGGEWKDNFDVIITTEVLAEGVNLHRANVILNYDTPWNSTRLMQRIGRVNRIGSKEPFVYVYNFMPSAEGDAKIQLVQKAHDKLQQFHVLFGEDSKIFSQNEDVYHYDLAKAVDGEESPLQKYVYELKQYKNNHPERFKLIEQAHEWQIAQAAKGTAYFLVKSPHSQMLAIKTLTDKNSEPPQVISLLELLEEVRADEDATAVPLPDNWHELSENALKAYNQHFVRINKSSAGDKATAAKAILVKINGTPGLSPQSKVLLKNARRLVDRGSYDIIKKILAISREIEDQNTRLFAINQQDINEILNCEIGKLLAKVEYQQGKASIVLGTIK